MLSTAMDKVSIMSEQMGDISKEMGVLREKMKLYIKRHGRMFGSINSIDMCEKRF